MNYILIGKTGSNIPAIRAGMFVNGIESHTMSPIDALSFKSESKNVKIIFIKVPFYYHWDSVMLPDYWSEIKRNVFNEEIMAFREADEIADKIFEYDGIGLDNLISDIMQWISSEVGSD